MGPAALSEAELVALVLRTGTGAGDALCVAHAALARFGGLRGLLDAPVVALEACAGLGPATASSLTAMAEIAARAASTPLDRGGRIHGPEAVERHFGPRLRVARQESFFALLLDGRHRFLAEAEVSRGTLTASLVHPREVFREAIRAAAAALVLVHNHPSGDPSPSAEDRAVTRRLRDAGALLGIEVLDHVIVASGGSYSFREAGEGFDPPAGFPLGSAPRSRLDPPRDTCRAGRTHSVPVRRDRSTEDCERGG